MYAYYPSDNEPFINASFIGNAAASTTDPPPVATFLQNGYMFLLWANTTGATQTYAGWANFQTGC